MAESAQPRFVVHPEIGEDGLVRVIDTENGEAIARLHPQYADIAYDLAWQLSIRALVNGTARVGV